MTTHFCRPTERMVWCSWTRPRYDFPMKKRRNVILPPFFFPPPMNIFKNFNASINWLDRFPVPCLKKSFQTTFCQPTSLHSSSKTAAGSILLNVIKMFRFDDKTRRAMYEGLYHKGQTSGMRFVTCSDLITIKTRSFETTKFSTKLISDAISGKGSNEEI